MIGMLLIEGLHLLQGKFFLLDQIEELLGNKDNLVLVGCSQGGLDRGLGLLQATVPGGDLVQAMAVLAAAKGCELSVRKPSQSGCRRISN